MRTITIRIRAESEDGAIAIAAAEALLDDLRDGFDCRYDGLVSEAEYRFESEGEYDDEEGE
jgi:hypothetical protein